ncbi:MAG: exodeoxyribonuclease V subunit alpha [Methylovulum sp.]|nr:exodeoxyribonuclease V subunit alpha [Methylovulum sp.]
MMVENQSYTRLDTAFARFLARRTRLDGKQKQVFEQLVAQLSYEQNQGHNCMQINDEDLALVLASSLADSCGTMPLVVENNRLYTQRYWHYEKRLVMQICSRVNSHAPVEQADAVLGRYFQSSSDAIDWQRAAANMAVRQPFCMITGGPGTGKTTTVVKILAVLQELAACHPLHIALAAPTGKAAMRLQESIGSRIAELPCSDDIKKHIPNTVSTLHRLLGAKPPSPYFHHDADNPLVYDLIVVDEASMVDLALMGKLFDALKPSARLILLGDKDQLASVESGAVLADLTQALPLCTLELKTSHRFAGTIKTLADAVNAQQAEAAWAILQGGDGRCALLEHDLIAYIAAQQAGYLQLIKSGADFHDIYQSFSRFQVLCANRQGENSIADMNYRVEQHLSGQKRINLSGLWYVGRPVMVTQNNAALHLYNGDIGICMPDSEQGGKLMVFFQNADGSVKKYLPARLPGCETVFAMTIHKSQGSEFDEVLIVLPKTINPVLTKELLYTAITRAKHTVKLVTDKIVFVQALAQKVARVTGLVDKFQHAG